MKEYVYMCKLKGDNSTATWRQ